VETVKRQLNSIPDSRDYCFCKKIKSKGGLFLVASILCRIAYHLNSSLNYTKRRGAPLEMHYNTAVLHLIIDMSKTSCELFSLHEDIARA
jgi:hypothetical protein